MTAVLVLVLLAFKLTTQASCLDTWPHEPTAWPNPSPPARQPQSPAIQATWESDDDNHRLLHLTLDELTGSKRVYIGAVNRIFQLSSDLKLEAQAVMGPELDDFECPVTRHCPPHVERKPSNYYNKALIIYTSAGANSAPAYTSTSLHSPNGQTPLHSSSSSSSSSGSLYPPNQQLSMSAADSQHSTQQRQINHQLHPGSATSVLISCGTLFQGSCALHNLENVANFKYPVNESVVANSPQASTVAFIAPGPTKQFHSRQHNVLYVAASYTGLGPYNAEIPAVSSRSLQAESLFNVLASDVASGTRLVLNSLSRDSFPITYVHGFSSKGFSYFLTVQKKSSILAKPFITKLIRVCQKDINYHSYVEVPLQCRMENGIDYNLAQAAYVGRPGNDLAQSLGITTDDEVLYVAFSKSSDKRDIYNEPSQQSALCVYSLPAIHHTFTQNIQHCFNGHGQQGLDFISRTDRCLLTQVHITDDFCGMDVNYPMSGSIPIDNTPVIEYKNLSITAVAASLINDFTVAYIGTSTGQLKRLVIENSTTAVEYSSVYVDPRRRTPINADIRFDKKDFIYVMNDRRISLIKLQECNSYKSCDDCLQAYDPYCGWCSLENRCSTKGTCAGANHDSLAWLSYKSGKCTTIKTVDPSQIQKTTIRTLSLAIDNLPSVDGPFLCGFTAQGKTEFTNASKTRANIVTCTTPMTDSLPALASPNHDLVTRLSVRMLNGPDFTATNFTFFDCSSYTTCTECVSSPYPCDWCVTGHRCTHDTGENCRNDVLITGANQKGSSARPGPKFCPRLDPAHGVTEILVSAGLPRRIQVQVKEMPPVITSDKFLCQFNVEGRVRQVNAQLLANIVYCDPMEFTYSRSSPNITASFAVIWGNSKPLDNPQDIHILVYQCSAMADNCGLCLELAEKYSCGWCKDSNSCQIQEHCPSQRPLFLVSLDTCPNPQITSFEPMSGPYEGGTSITIRGINMGRSFEDLQVSLELTNSQEMKLGQIECVPIEGSYIRTSQITCQLPNSPVTGAYGTILVKIANEFVARSTERFVFVNPSITSFVPAKGPKSGGTKLTLWGLDMNAGSRAEVNVGSSPCLLIGRSHERADCVTSRAQGIGEQRVSMKFDNAEKSFIDYNFLYVEDPEVDIVTSPQASYMHSSFVNRSPPPRGIPAGGITVHVKGKSFISIQQPRFYVVVDGIKYNGSCQVENATEMNCLSPYVPEEKISVYRMSPEEPVELDYGFFLDNVEEVHNLASRRDSRFPMFLMYSNPEYRPFPEEVKFYKSDYLTINGSNLDRASSEYDIMVRIGKGYCNVTSLSRTQLTCKPPPIQPEALNWIGQSNSNLLPDVVVHVGNSLNFTIGKLSYDSLDGFDGPLPRSIMTVLVIGACFLMLVVVFILIAYRRKASESNRVVKTMQEQMDVLEMKVASEAKQAFTELQTEMTDLTDDLEHGGIPYLDYRIYAMKVLFPSSSDHPVLSEMQVDQKIRPHFERGLASFDQLIMNKTFLLLFIRTLESNRYFSMRDRVNVASLIMVTLQNRMEYCTDILKTLLADLIERSMESRSHPKLLLRRTESVAEKMLSSWFTFLLYKFLRECAGEPLFLLYQAIKHQVNKGPVDVITSEARCSLSEEKLIRQSVDYKPLIVYVSISPQTAYLSGVDPNLQTENLELGVKVLDCDTISQVKEKAIDAIYKSTPYSQRPSKDNLNLEWLATPATRVIMSDEDHTTKTEGYWKRLNTLAHYRVPDGARLILVTKQSSLYNMSLGGAGSDKHRYETLSHFGKSLVSSPISRPLSPLTGSGGSGGVELLHSDNPGHKYWHLVRHHDNDYRDGERSAKMVSEIYLTRLLATKGTLQRFVDDLFETIFSTARLTSSLPIAIKYMFDFLDDQARGHGITDPEVVHTWKSNSLPLRFWVNLIKNPNFVFDINKSNIVDSCLSVVAQTFMDACSTSEHRLGKDSPSSKLLYAKDLPIYKDWVERYYNEIAMMPPINEQDMNAMLAEETRQHAHEFNTNVSLHELYKYAIKYQEQLMFTLDEDEFAKKFKLSARLRQTMLIMNGDTGGDVLLPI